MNYKIDINPEWKFQYTKEQSKVIHSEFGRQQLILRGSWIMNILNFLFPFGVIFGVLLYIQQMENFKEIVIYCIYVIEMCIFCYLIFSILKSVGKKVIFYESGLMIKYGSKEINIPYYKIVNISLEKSSYHRSNTSLLHWMNSVIPITIISIVTKDGLSVSLTSEDFLDLERKIKKFMENIAKEEDKK